MNKKAKLNTEIEKLIHKHVDTIMESTIDSVYLYVRRNNIELDRESLSATLEIIRKILPGEHMSKLDVFLRKLDKTLDEFVAENE